MKPFSRQKFLHSTVHGRETSDSRMLCHPKGNNINADWRDSSFVPKKQSAVSISVSESFVYDVHQRLFSDESV